MHIWITLRQVLGWQDPDALQRLWSCQSLASKLVSFRTIDLPHCPECVSISRISNYQLAIWEGKVDTNWQHQIFCWTIYTIATDVWYERQYSLVSVNIYYILFDSFVSFIVCHNYFSIRLFKMNFAFWVTSLALLASLLKNTHEQKTVLNQSLPLGFHTQAESSLGYY